MLLYNMLKKGSSHPRWTTHGRLVPPVGSHVALDFSEENLQGSPFTQLPMPCTVKRVLLTGDPAVRLCHRCSLRAAPVSDLPHMYGARLKPGQTPASAAEIGCRSQPVSATTAVRARVSSASASKKDSVDAALDERLHPSGSLQQQSAAATLDNIVQQNAATYALHRCVANVMICFSTSDPQQHSCLQHSRATVAALQDSSPQTQACKTFCWR